MSEEWEGDIVSLFKVFCNVVSSVIVVLLVVIVIVLYGAKPFGIDAYTVLSGSMEPVYKTGSIVYVKKCSISDVKVEDVVTFHAEGTTVATHRLVRINDEEKTFVTKGDANSFEDASTPFGSLIGKVVFSVPLAGYVMAYITSSTGKGAIIALFSVALLLMLLPSLFGKSESKKEKRKAD